MDVYRPAVQLAERTDDELMASIAGATSRDAAFRELVRRHGAAMTAVARAVLRDRDRSDDVVQEALLRVYEARERWAPGKGSLRAWLLRIARNLALNALRDGKRRGAAPLDEEAARDDGPPPGAALEDDEDVSALREALGALPGADREVLALRYQQGLGFDEIGGVVGSSGAAVKQRAWRALKRLRALLGAGDGRDGEGA